MSKVILLNRFDCKGELVSSEIYKGISRLHQDEILIYKGKPLTERMVYKRFQESGKDLKGDSWRLQEKTLKRSTARQK